MKTHVHESMIPSAVEHERNRIRKAVEKMEKCTDCPMCGDLISRDDVLAEIDKEAK